MTSLKTFILTAGLLTLSGVTFAGNSAREHLQGQSYDHKGQRHSQHHQSQNYKKPKKHGHKSNNKHYYDYGYGFNSPYRDHRESRYHRNYRNHDHRNRDYRSYNRYNHQHFSNYQPYYDDRYRYRPLRGLGHYFYRTGYGYGHWHEGMWCDTYHPDSYYYNYYSNYPYNDGWRIGDGDFGIWFRF